MPTEAAHIALRREFGDDVALAQITHRAEQTDLRLLLLLLSLGLFISLLVVLFSSAHIIHLRALICQIKIEEELSEDRPVVRKIKHVVRIITLQLQTALIFIAATVEEYAIGPRRVPLQSIARVVEGLTLERWSECNLTFLEKAWHVTELSLQV